MRFTRLELLHVSLAEEAQPFGTQKLLLNARCEPPRPVRFPRLIPEIGFADHITRSEIHAIRLADKEARPATDQDVAAIGAPR